jgi:hypothetical protein
MVTVDEMKPDEKPVGKLKSVRIPCDKMISLTLNGEDIWNGLLRIHALHAFDRRPDSTTFRALSLQCARVKESR